MTRRYAVRFPTLEHLERFRSVVDSSPDRETIRSLLDALADDPCPASFGFEKVPPEEEALLLLNNIGFSLPADSFAHVYRAIACCRIENAGYEVLYDVMDDLRIV